MLSGAQAKLIRKLRSRKHRDESGAFLAEGVRVVEELLSSDLEIQFVVGSPALGSTPRGCRLQESLAAGPWRTMTTSDAELKKLADTETPQGVLAVARKPRGALAELGVGGDSAVLVFDRVSDPGNLGTLVRTARALGASCAIALPGTADLWGPKAVRASAGSLFHLPTCEATWVETLAWLRLREFAILCADPAGPPVSRAGEPLRRFALVLGNEPAGISEEVRRDCERRVSVQLPGSMDSLNVAIAGALLLDRLLAHSTRDS